MTTLELPAVPSASSPVLEVLPPVELTALLVSVRPVTLVLVPVRVQVSVLLPVRA
jgi:hypothetical protein